MDPEAWKRVQGLVDEALDLTEADRRAFLETVGARSPELRRELDAFLAAEAASRGFLDAPAPLHAAALTGALRDPSWEREPVEGRSVGPYRVLRELGRGGMGAVFLAERVDGGFDQRVALKLVRLGMESADVQARFRSERQILARLQHPHIARLLDGGLTDAGHPYFAMEYVDGRALGLYCDQAGLSIADRLRLFLQVCEAVEHAHRNLIVHRDLKPSNILVTAEGQVMLLDFGIAKALDASGDSSEALTVTRGDARALTPRYAAPEQLQGGPITTATDVYSLGIVLYELLCGRHPYRLRGLSAPDVERVLLNDEPEPLSKAVGRDEDDASAVEIARARGLGPDRLRAGLQGDLEKLVARAIRKEPARRYPSVDALAADVRRFLAGRPVSARGDALGYRLSKFVRRHRLAVASAAVVVVLGIAAVLGIVWQARKAVLQARRAEEVKRFTLGLFEMSDPDAAKGQEVTARQLLARGTERVHKELADQPEVQVEMLLYLADIYHLQALDAEARPLLEKALTIRRDTLRADELAVSEVEEALASNSMHRGELDRANELCERVLAVFLRRLGAEQAKTADVRALLGKVRFERGELASAETLLGEAIAYQRRHLPATTEELASNLGWLGRVHHTRQDLAAAESRYRESLELLRGLHGEDHSLVATELHNLAFVMRDRGDYGGAEAQFRQALAIQRRLLGPRHTSCANSLTTLATTLMVKGEYAEAETLLRESVAIMTEHHSSHRGNSLHQLAKALRLRAKLSEAERTSREALALTVAQFGDEHTNVAAVREELANILREQGQPREAEDLARRALAIDQKKLGRDHPQTAAAHLTLGLVLLKAGRPAEAESSVREALKIRQGRFGEGDWRTAEAHLRLAECLLARDQRTTGESERASAESVLTERMGPQHPLAARARALRTSPGSSSSR